MTPCEQALGNSEKEKLTFDRKKLQEETGRGDGRGTKTHSGRETETEDEDTLSA